MWGYVSKCLSFIASLSVQFGDKIIEGKSTINLNAEYLLLKATYNIKPLPKNQKMAFICIHYKVVDKPF